MAEPTDYLVIVYESNLCDEWRFIKYQNIFFMYSAVFSFISHYCTVVSFVRVIHPDTLGFTFSFLLIFLTSIMTALGVGSAFYFHSRRSFTVQTTRVSARFSGGKGSTQVKQPTRKLFVPKWGRKAEFYIKCRVIFNEVDKDPELTKMRTSVCCVWW